MKRYILGILFFSGLWGLSEALLGGYLYDAKVPGASIPLTIIAFAILTVASLYFPKPGTATLIALCAMLYKFFNSPFFACHLVGIAMVGVSFDLFLVFFDIKNKAVAGFVAAFFNYVAFAVLMTFIIRYHYWTSSMAKFNSHLVKGIFAAVGCAIIVPIMLKTGQLIMVKLEMPLSLRLNAARGAVCFATAALWSVSMVGFWHTLITGQ